MSQQINLFDPRLVPKPPPLPALLCASLLGGFLLLLVLGYALILIQARGAESRSREAAARAQVLQQEVVEAARRAAPPPVDARLEAETRRLEQRHDALQRVVGVLKSGALGNTRGFSEYWRALARQAVDGLWLTGFRLGGAAGELTLEGRMTGSELLPLYVQRLETEAVLHGRSFADLRMASPQTPPDAPPAGFLEFRLSSRPDEGKPFGVAQDRHER
ncbi:MAG TPA: hypothetical protein VI457_09355 [Methylococcaceae bacterium]|nr:hypothetical protein [Methylococcaceae bacterium]